MIVRSSVSNYAEFHRWNNRSNYFRLFVNLLVEQAKATMYVDLYAAPKKVRLVKYFIFRQFHHDLGILDFFVPCLRFGKRDCHNWFNRLTTR
jgi:hypothetical protein